MGSLSEDIFRCLHWSIQKKFKVAIKRVENIRNKLCDMNDDTIPYEDRIVQMKTTDSIKSKAFEKLKELKVSKDSVKAQNYLDGLLKIPFGIFKKEKILSFLDDFTKNITKLMSEIEDSLKELNNDDDTIIFIKNNLQELSNYFKNDDYDTSHKLENFFRKLEDYLFKINNVIKLDLKYNKISINDSDNKNEQNISLDKLEKIKQINEELDNCDDDKLLNNIELKISNSIK